MVRKQTWVQYLFGALCAFLLVPAVALAAQSSSPSYQVNEVLFGSGSELNACSSQYCSKQSAGDLVVGKTCSDPAGLYCAEGGFNTDRTPYIEFKVSDTNINLGTLTSATTKTASATFSVKAYLAHGYSVINASDPPINNDYTMKALAAPTASSVGAEQFGINLVANTDPVAFGADPVQTPDSSFARGRVSADYAAPNLYKYAKGDAIAYSTSSTSATAYTVSYLFNISSVTPGGTYNMRHVLVATATF